MFPVPQAPKNIPNNNNRNYYNDNYGYNRGYRDGYRDSRCGWVTFYRYEEDYYGRVYLIERQEYHCQGDRW